MSSAAYALAITVTSVALACHFSRLAALPRAGSTPIDTASCLPPEARGLAKTWRNSLLRDPKEAEILRAELGLVKTLLSTRVGAARFSIQCFFASIPVRRE